MSTSVDGLVSGMQTSSMINQLMQVEAAPQTKLKTKVETAQTAVTSYQSVNAKLKAVKSAAESMARLETWRAVKATSSSDAVTATASGSVSSMAGAITFDVEKVARAQTSVLRVDTTSETFPTQFTIQKGGWADTDDDPLTENDAFTPDDTDPAVIEVGTPPTAAKVAAAVNAADIGIRAYVVTTGPNQGALQFTSSKTGAAQGFEITGLVDPSNPGEEITSSSSRDASLKLNPGTPSEYKVTSSTNTFTDVMPGVTITASKVQTGVTVTAASDVSAMTAKIQAYVDAANAAFTEIKTQTAYDAETKTGSPLTGDFTVRQMNQAMLSMISGGLTYDKKIFDANGEVESTEQVSFGSLSQLGIELDATGQLSFTASKFEAEYAKDPSRIQSGAIGFANQVKETVTKQSNTVTDVITGRKNEIDSLNEQVSNWDVRLSARRMALQRQYAALETALGKMQNQSTWLAGQLSGLS
ncbi:flagellar filament capping protein FliD [Actinoplanes sp. NPDC023936]|uniref:flagellar filament capping protein FliD n=1 Tax=Actinoplanes sp. NPDC023936 TaxID=3154910 RepID=UPI0033C05A01